MGVCPFSELSTCTVSEDFLRVHLELMTAFQRSTTGAPAVEQKHSATAAGDASCWELAQ